MTLAEVFMRAYAGHCLGTGSTEPGPYFAEGATFGAVRYPMLETDDGARAVYAAGFEHGIEEAFRRVAVALQIAEEIGGERRLWQEALALLIDEGCDLETVDERLRAIVAAMAGLRAEHPLH